MRCDVQARRGKSVGLAQEVRNFRGKVRGQGGAVGKVLTIENEELEERREICA